MAKFVFVLSRDEIEAATRCFQLAKIAHSKGHLVNIFLLSDGVLWANSKRDFKMKTTTRDLFLNRYFQYLVEKEVEIGV